jgi:hypothetical protein
MTDWLLEKLRRQLEHARIIGDRGAITMLTARIKAREMSVWSELEKRYAAGDR